MKVAELGKLMRGFGCGLVQNHNGQCEENAHLGRFPRADDEELSAPRALTIKGEDDLLDEALSCLYSYNTMREIKLRTGEAEGALMFDPAP
jgi:hypothetical protein